MSLLFPKGAGVDLVLLPGVPDPHLPRLEGRDVVLQLPAEMTDVVPAVRLVGQRVHRVQLGELIHDAVHLVVFEGVLTRVEHHVLELQLRRFRFDGVADEDVLDRHRIFDEGVEILSALVHEGLGLRDRARVRHCLDLGLIIELGEKLHGGLHWNNFYCDVSFWFFRV